MKQAKPVVAQPARKRIFVSHVAFESELAKVLAEWITKAFPRRVDVFVSATGMAIGAFPPQIEKQLRASNALLVLASKFSAGSTWVSFEAGFAKALGIATIPVYSPPLTESQLPPTLAQLQTRRISAQDFPRQLIRRDLSRELDLTPRRGFAYESMRKALFSARKQQGLMLKLLETLKGRPAAECTPPKLAESLNRAVDTTRDALESLISGDYAGEVDVDDPNEMGYQLTKRGSSIVELGA